MLVNEVIKDSESRIGQIVTLNGILIYDGIECWISDPNVNPSNKKSAILVDYDDLYKNHISAISCMVGGSYFCMLKTTINGRLKKTINQEFTLSLSDIEELSVWNEEGDLLTIDLSKSNLLLSDAEID